MIQGITAPGGSWLLFQHNQKDGRKEISNMEKAHLIGAEEVTDLVLIGEENYNWISQSPTFTW